jgi:hypothetical protein
VSIGKSGGLSVAATNPVRTPTPLHFGGGSIRPNGGRLLSSPVRSLARQWAGLSRPLAAVDRSHREHVPFRHLGIGLGARRMSNLLFWLGIGAAQKGAGSKTLERRHWVASLVVGILIAVLIAAGAFILLVSQK